MNSPGPRAGMLSRARSGVRRRLLTARLRWEGGRGRPMVLLICFDLRSLGATDAIRKEALDLRDAVGAALPGAAGALVSMERTLTRPAWEARHRALCWPVSETAGLLRRIRPDLVHVVEETVGAFFGLGLDRGSPCPVLLTAAGADPVQLASEGPLAFLRHAMDVRTLSLVVESEAAAARCEAAGLRCAAVIPPAVEPGGQWDPTTDPEPFTVGFASSPLSATAWEARGIPLLLDAAAVLPEVRFLFAWREGAPPVGEAVRARDLRNIEVLQGTLDMAQFYGRIHSLLLPFTRAAGNHACPYSGVEALVRGIPLVVTPDVGLADTVTRFGLGQVVAATPAAIADGVRRVRAGWSEMRGRTLRVGPDLFPPAARARRYGALYAQLARLAPAPPLHTWEAMAAASGTPLIRSRVGLRAHYDAQNVAESYIRRRFDSPPLQAAEEAERAAVAEIVAVHTQHRGTLRALDIASGEGRILRTLMPLATCVALEPAAAMVSQSRRVVPDGARVAFVRGDAFAPPFRPGPLFDIVTLFRFLRHHPYPERQRLYLAARRLLRPDGLLLADFPNGVAETRLRNHHGWNHYPVYDAFWSAEEAEAELRRNGFIPLRLIPVGAALFPNLIPWPEEPLLWVGAFSAAAGECLASGGHKESAAHRGVPAPLDPGEA